MVSLSNHRPEPVEGQAKHERLIFSVHTMD